jgi:hypothetical protein
MHETESVADGLTEGDGVDPREEKKARLARTAAGKRDYAVLRLASQIRDILDLALPASGHPLLASMVVGAVEPSSTGATYVVQVYSADHAADYDPREVKAALDQMKPRLRAEVAKEVTRKNAPDFKFDVLPPRVQPR